MAEGTAGRCTTGRRDKERGPRTRRTTAGKGTVRRLRAARECVGPETVRRAVRSSVHGEDLSEERKRQKQVARMRDALRTGTIRSAREMSLRRRSNVGHQWRAQRVHCMPRLDRSWDWRVGCWNLGRGLIGTPRLKRS
jgi:hypothetical protein